MTSSRLMRHRLLTQSRSKRAYPIRHWRHRKVRHLQVRMLHSITATGLTANLEIPLKLDGHIKLTIAFLLVKWRINLLCKRRVIGMRSKVKVLMRGLIKVRLMGILYKSSVAAHLATPTVKGSASRSLFIRIKVQSPSA